MTKTFRNVYIGTMNDAIRDCWLVVVRLKFNVIHVYIYVLYYFMIIMSIKILCELLENDKKKNDF